MASITFEGPNPLSPAERSETTAKFSDETMLATVEAICHSYGYSFTVKNEQGEDTPNPTGPGTFAIEKILAFCRDTTVAFNTNRAQEVARATATESLKKLDDITLERGK